MPVCKICNLEKPVGDFYLRDPKKHVTTSYCKECNKEKVKKWRKTPEGRVKFRALEKKRYDKNREWLNEEKAKGCEKCGDTRFFVVDFHHLDPSLKSFTFGAQNRMGSRQQLEIELQKCCRLCANCHREFHYREKVENMTIVEYLNKKNKT